MKNLVRLIAVFLPAILIIFSFVVPAQAVYFETGDILALPKDKKIDETVLISGSSLTIDSEINGDLLCAGRDVVVNGKIKGDVLCAAQTIKINGTVDGDVRVAAQTVEVGGIVTRNLYTLSQSLSLTKFSSVKGDIFFGVQSVDLRGVLGRDMLGAAEELTVSGSLIRNAKVTASRISLIDPAKIGGDFEYYTDNVGTGSVSQKNVKGRILRHEIVRNTPRKIENAPSFIAAGKILSVISYFVLGLAIVYFLKKRLAERIGIITGKPVVVGLTGFAVLFLTPIVIILLMATVIGIPLALVLIFEYIISLITAAIYPALILGDWLLVTLFKKKSTKPIWQLVTGSLAVGIIMCIPVIGFFTGVVMLCLGLGSIFLSYLPEK